MTIRSLFKTLASHNTLCKSFGYREHLIRVQVDNLTFEGDSTNDFINNVTEKGYPWELAYKVLDLEVKTGKNPMPATVNEFAFISVSLIKKELSKDER